MRGFLHWLGSGSRPAAEDNRPGDFDPYVVELVRRKASLWARAADAKPN
jgi:hypothetical protein